MEYKKKKDSIKTNTKNIDTKDSSFIEKKISGKRKKIRHTLR